MTTPSAQRALFFALSDVRLLDGPFKHAQDRNRAVLAAHNPDRLLAPFRIEAGLEPRAPAYASWESTGLGGQTAGHYLTALAQTWAATGDAEMKRRLDYMVGDIAQCQDAHADGYVGGVPGGRVLWREVAAGRLQVEPFAVNRAWVPWYNLHKTFAGLRDACRIGGNAQAREVLIRLSDWCDALVANLSDEQMQDMLRAEHGGMNEVLADVSAMTDDPTYLRLAQRFSHRRILDPLLRHEDQLTGLHANTQIPKVIGFARIAELGGDADWLDASRFFWETVTEHRSVAFGGNSVREHFNPPDDFASVIRSREGPETCNTYNMLRLTEQLFRADPSARYGDYYERALYNHILSSVHPDHGGYVYFTPLRPRHYRVYSQPETCFWCCVGSGMENHGKYGRFIYAHDDASLWINLFIASELTWAEPGIRVRQETRFPDEPRTTLRFSMKAPRRMPVRVRHPRWVEPGALRIRVNGEPWTVSSAPGSYVPVDRQWRDGDRMEIELPMRTAVERLPDGSDYVAILRGPIVLAAATGTEQMDGLIADGERFSHAAPGAYLPLDESPMLVGDVSTFADHIKPVPGKPMAFTVADLIRPVSYAKLELVPFYQLHDSRYMLYWPVVATNAYSRLIARLKAAEAERVALDDRTLDRVTPGEQQPEVEHNYQGEDSGTGVHLARPWRDATQWFSYDLKAVPDHPVELRVTYFDGDRGRHFDILVNDHPVASVHLDGGDPDRFVDVTYPIPHSAVSAAVGEVLTVKFVAHEGSRAGGVYGVRLLEQASAP